MMDKTAGKERIDEMIEATMKVARGDYSAQVELSGRNDEVDSLAMGLNMMVDDIRTSGEVLRESEEKYRSLVNNIKLGIFRSTPGPTGKFLAVNLAMKELTGYSRKELLQMNVSDLYMYPEQREQVLEEVASAKGKVMKELRFRKKGGTEIVVSATSVTVRDSAGKIQYFDGILEDITERKRAEHNLRERIKELSCLYGMASIAERPGITQDELYQEVANLLPSSWQYPEVTCARVTINGKKFRTENCKDTKWKQSADVKVHGARAGLVEVSYLEERPELDEGPFLKEERLLIDAVAERLGRITERKQAEEELREKNERLDAQNEELQVQGEELMAQQQELMDKTREVEEADRLKSEFLANMSHELRTPLNVIIGFSELMADEAAGKINNEQRQWLNDILNSGRHLLNLINEVLDLSKIESGKMKFRLTDISLADVIQSLARTLVPVLTPRKQSLDIEVEKKLPLVHANKAKVGQVLLNLVDNASKFTPGGGKLKIEAVRAGDWCQVSVVDNGIGIRKEDQNRIFEPFYQLDNPLVKEKSGAGLGLALVRQIIDRHGGRIWVESEYGKGSRFIFTLPLATAS